MIANNTYTKKDTRFWAVVKLTSETIGYSNRQKKDSTLPVMKLYSEKDIVNAHKKNKLPLDFCFSSDGQPKERTRQIINYLNYRNDLIEKNIKMQLMNRNEAKKEYSELVAKYPDHGIKIQMNKQKGKKRHPNYLVNIVNLLTLSVLGNDQFNDDPHRMGIISDNKGPLKILCRRMDGAIPSIINPKIIWEIKEYYGTTTFGSRVADGVYETMLVGEELRELKKEHDIKVFHVLFVDDYYTWWQLGRSYLCRLVDMLHIGYVDAIFFGREVINEWPQYIKTVLPSK